MDNHPIPQDVTHFQFKLIGELTIKQFAYVAGGGILAWITISLPINFFIKLLLALIFGGSGAFFAFIPIEARSADLMLTYFFKALFKPNQFIFHKEHGLSITDMHYALLTMPQAQQSMTVAPVVQPVNTNLALSTQQSQPQFIPPQQQYTPQAQNAIKPVIPAPLPQIPIIDKQKAESVSPPMGQQLQDALAQKEQLEKQLALLRQQLSQKPQQDPVPPPLPANSPLTPVKKVSPLPSASKMPMVSDFPNIIIGIVQDSRGNVLPNILVEVKDKEGNPVRAFKTNALGQFASATSLLNGVYMIIFEDPEKKHKFDAIQVSVDGEIMQPIEVTSIDDREELRKELFGQ